LNLPLLQVEIIQDDRGGESISKQLTDGEMYDSSILQNYKSMYETGLFTDVVLVVGECELRVHKCILAARSPVFTAMFEHKETKEAQENRVEITDLSIEVCRILVEYIYTGKVNSVHEYALELLEAADKYQLDHLKNSCALYLSSHLNVESVARILLTADLHEIKELKDKCFNFIITKGPSVIETTGWSKLTELRPKLGVELFEYLITQQHISSNDAQSSKLK